MQVPGRAPTRRRVLRRALTVSSCAIALAAIAGGEARAEGIGVIAAASSGDDRAAAAAAMAEAIAGGGGRGQVAADAIGEARAALAAGAVPVATLARFRRVREMIDDGWRAFQRVQIDFAQNRLAAARSEAEALVALSGGAELYADAALRLGAVMTYRRVPDAPAVLALALALDPERPITLAEFSPDVVDAVAAARAAHAATQRVHIATRPAGAIVSLDGAELGPAPLDADVARGQHLIVARAPRHRAAVQGVAIGGTDAPAAVDLTLEADDDAIRLAAGAEPGLPAPVELALVDATIGTADLDEVVIAAIGQRHGGPALIVQRCGGAPVKCTPPAEVGYPDRAGLPAAAREAWRAVQGGPLSEPPQVLRDAGERPPPSGCQLCRNPLVWTGVGAAVVTAAIVIAVTSGSKPPPVVTIDGRDFGK